MNKTPEQQPTQEQDPTAVTSEQNGTVPTADRPEETADQATPPGELHHRLSPMDPVPEPDGHLHDFRRYLDHNQLREELSPSKNATGSDPTKDSGSISLEALRRLRDATKTLEITDFNYEEQYLDFALEKQPFPFRKNSLGSSDLFKQVKIFPWSEYPLCTKAPAINGGWWYKMADGWKWNGPDGNGDTFPTPGADADGTVILPYNSLPLKKLDIDLSGITLNERVPEQDLRYLPRRPFQAEKPLPPDFKAKSIKDP